MILHWRIFWPSSAGSGRASRNLPPPSPRRSCRRRTPQAGAVPEYQEQASQEQPYQEQAIPEPEAPAQEAAEDLNAYAAGAAYEEAPAPGEESGAKKKKKKRKGGLFGRKKKVPDFDESEDLYYGIQLKPIDEYSKGYDGATGEFTLPEDSFKSLFDDSKKAIDDEVEQNFQKLQKERRRRVAEAVHNAGVDEEQIADEFGVVAPMPVTAFAADPYAKQHGIEVEGAKDQGALPEIQKAMLETSTDQTMEIKLNVMNDTVELQRVKDLPSVSEESVEKILSAAGEQMDQLEDMPPEAAAPQPLEEAPAPELPEPLPVEAAQAQEEPPAREEAPAEVPAQEQAPAPKEPVVLNRALGEIPQVASIYEYRSRSIPTHIIHADLLQSALLSEEEDLRKAKEEDTKTAPRRRVRNPKLEDKTQVGGAAHSPGPGDRGVHRRLHRAGGRQVHLLRAAGGHAGAVFADDDHRGVHGAAGPGEPDFRRAVCRGRGRGFQAPGVRDPHPGAAGGGRRGVLPDHRQRAEGPVRL